MRLRFRHGWVLCLSLIGLLLPVAAQPCPPDLRIGFNEKDSPPYLLGVGASFAQPAGLLVEWTQQALQDFKCQGARLSRAPVRRLALDVETGALHFVMGFAHTPERARTMRFPLTPSGALNELRLLGEVNVHLFVLQQAPAAQWDGRALTPPTATVGVVGGAIDENLARARQWPLDVGLNYSANLKKLRQGRVAALLAPELTLSPADLQAEPRVAPVGPPLWRSLYFAPANAAFYAQHPAFVEAFWLRLCELAQPHRHTPSACG
ncbi:hypothetical protein [Inhella gelatinilytica]|uniref:Solute-binding protein family 3/N-terminal domain-containing protein n=1 Tax=Inhella gelatinilytica TaxID=2795030 RepID=A0A931NDA5_9BURK|nr:hypothetical protein [Inhella gelatinilytica]MBH9552035.1 hypothetical protein [Inhella gelatinilytica]